MEMISIEGINLAYRVFGNGEQPILFVHGNLGSSRWWDFVAHDFSNDFKVYVVDLRGHGSSSKPENDYSISKYANDLLSFINKLHLENVILVGHSMGGAIVMQMAVSTPKNIDKVILINPAPVQGFYTPEERYALIASYGTNRELLSMSLKAVVPTLNDETFFQKLVDDALIGSHTAVPNAKSLSEFNVVKDLKDWNIPTLLLFGQKDLLVTEEMTDENAKNIPNVMYKKFPDVGHSLPVEAPEIFVDEALKFLGGS